MKKIIFIIGIALFVICSILTCGRLILCIRNYPEGNTYGETDEWAKKYPLTHHLARIFRPIV